MTEEETSKVEHNSPRLSVCAFGATLLPLLVFIPGVAVSVDALGWISIISIIGLLMGWTALKMRAAHKIFAIGAIVLACFWLGFTVYAMASSLRCARELARSAESSSNLRRVGVGIEMYRKEYDSQWPEGFGVLVEKKYITPGSLQYPRYEDDEVDYVLIDSQQAGELPDDALVACERTNFRKEGRNVLLKNGEVEWMKEEDLQEALKKPENAPLAAALKRGSQPLKSGR